MRSNAGWISRSNDGGVRVGFSSDTLIVGQALIRTRRNTDGQSEIRPSRRMLKV